jgi:endonuclease/exonuclease/phosphatase family metal-dependent hydrolase
VVAADARVPPPSVEWLGPADRKDRGALDAWCRTVGPVVIGTPASAFEGPIDDIVLLGWNAHVGGGDLARLVGAIRTGRFTQGAPVRHFVLAVQEAYRSSAALPDIHGLEVPVPRGINPAARHEDVASSAARLGLALYYVPSMRNGRGGPGLSREDRGNAILSTMPLHRLQALELPFERQRRVAIGATVEGAMSSGLPWSLRILNVHFDSLSGPDELWVGGPRARRRQARALVGALPEEGPLVLAGDLNAWGGPGEDAVRMIARAFPPPAAVDERPTFRRQRLDYLFHRLPAGWAIDTRRLDDRFGSDHYPLLALVRPGGATP